MSRLVKPIRIGEHVISRFMSDRFPQSRPKNKEKAKKQIEKDIRLGKLLKINPDGSELIGHNGKIYACIDTPAEIVVKTILKGNKNVN